MIRVGLSIETVGAGVGATAIVIYGDKGRNNPDYSGCDEARWSRF